jgi:very-short-patch-repair endonuclease
VPTLSVLVATRDAGTKMWEAWAAGRPTAIVSNESPRDIVCGWLNAMPFDSWRLAGAARLGSSGASTQILAGADSIERRNLLDRLVAAEGDAALAAASRGLIEGVGAASTWDLLDERVAGREPDGPWYRLIRPLARIAGDGAPTLLFIPFSGRLAASIEAAGSVVVRAPTLPVCIVADATEHERYLREAPESRWKALAREGSIRAGAGQARTRTQPIPTYAPPPAEAALARSAAEKYLFDRLEENAPTAGLFRLHDELDGMEIDLLSRVRRVAIEVDAYHQVSDPATYRRDRRKDVALQQRGYLVLRFLAEDVSERLDEVLREIVRILAWRESDRG